MHPPNASELRGGMRITNVGPGSARSFATGAIPSTTHANVPMFLRAFAKLIDEGDGSHNLPRATIISSYKCSSARRERHGKKRSPLSSVCWRMPNGDSFHKSSRRSRRINAVDRWAFPRPAQFDINTYFPLPTLPLPPQPETLVMPGRTTTLSITPSPLLSDVFLPTTDIEYQVAEIGRQVFADLTRGVVPTLGAFAEYRSTRLMPLLYKLKSLGVIDNTEIDSPPRRVEVDGSGTSAILMLNFVDRSIDNLRAILGETIEGDKDWLTIEEHESSRLDALDLYPSITEEEMELEDWDSSAGSISPESSLEVASEAWVSSNPTSGLNSLAQLPELHAQLANTDDLVMPIPDSQVPEVQHTPPQQYSCHSSQMSSVADGSSRFSMVSSLTSLVLYDSLASASSDGESEPDPPGMPSFISSSPNADIASISDVESQLGQSPLSSSLSSFLSSVLDARENVSVASEWNENASPSIDDLNLESSIWSSGMSSTGSASEAVAEQWDLTDGVTRKESGRTDDP